MRTESIYADLHTHTHYSDGTLAPDTLIQRAAERGLQVLAVTDHDTLDGLEVARNAAQQHGLQLVNGVELSVKVDDHSVHLLGYGFDPSHTALTDYLLTFAARRRERLDQMVRRLSEHGVEISTATIDRTVECTAAPGRPHLAQALVEEGHVADYRSAFEEYIGTDHPAYVPAPTQPASAAIEALHAAGGVAVLAHPGQWMPGEVVQTLRGQGLDGIECIAPSHPDYLVDYYETLCRSHDLVVTGGSDYHGHSENEAQLGAVGLKRAQWERFRTAVL